MRSRRERFSARTGALVPSTPDKTWFLLRPTGRVQVQPAAVSPA